MVFFLGWFVDYADALSTAGEAYLGLLPDDPCDRLSQCLGGWAISLAMQARTRVKVVATVRRTVVCQSLRLAGMDVMPVVFR